MEEYRALITGQHPSASPSTPTGGDHERFDDVKQPVYIRDNLYLGGAEPFEAEKGAIVLTDNHATVQVVDEGGEVHLETQLPDAFDSAAAGVITGADLQPVRFVDADFEDPDGTAATLDTDLIGERKNRSQTYPAGPVAALRAGSHRTRVW
jgi:hypothetical protein